MSDEAKKLTAEEQAFWDAAAIAAMQGILAGHASNPDMWNDEEPESTAGLACRRADALLERRRERGQQ